MNEIRLLLKKDVKNLLAVLWWYPLILVFLSIIFGIFVPAYLYLFVPCLWVYVGCYNLFLVEERSQSQILAFTLPIRLESFVAARFLLGAGGGAALVLLGTLSGMGAALLGGPGNSLTTFFFGAGVSCILTAGMLTPLFLWGSRRSRVFTLVLYMVGIVGMPILGTVFNQDMLGYSFFPASTGLLVLGIGLLLLFLGYRLSVAACYRTHMAEVA